MKTPIDNELTRQFELVKWIDTHFKIALPTDRRSLSSSSCFDIVIEHHAAICLLCENQVYGSMFALLRIVVDTYVRGLWLQYCASEEDIDLYEKDKCEIKFNEMSALLNKHFDVASTAPFKFEYNKWRLLNSFTHAGYQHLLRRNVAGKIGPVNYAPAEVCSALKLSGTYSLLSVIGLAGLSGNQKFVEKALLTAKKYMLEIVL